VEWLDAYFSDTLPKDVNMVRTTAGWLVQNNKRVVRVALTYDDRGAADMMTIPRGMVRSVRIVDAKTLRDEQIPADDVEPTEADHAEAARGY
jgi:hypothetical protein